MENVTGRDGYIMRKALAIAIEAISRAEPSRRPYSDQADMARLLTHMTPDSALMSLASRDARVLYEDMSEAEFVGLFTRKEGEPLATTVLEQWDRQTA